MENQFKVVLEPVFDSAIDIVAEIMLITTLILDGFMKSDYHKLALIAYAEKKYNAALMYHENKVPFSNSADFMIANITATECDIFLCIKKIAADARTYLFSKDSKYSHIHLDEFCAEKTFKELGIALTVFIKEHGKLPTNQEAEQMLQDQCATHLPAKPISVIPISIVQ